MHPTRGLHAQRGAALRVRRGKRETQLGMAENEGAQLTPRVPTRPQHAHAGSATGIGGKRELRQVR